MQMRSPAKDSGPWKTDKLEMWKKTVIRRMSKRWLFAKGARGNLIGRRPGWTLGAPVVRKSRIVLEEPEAREPAKLTGKVPTLFLIW